jgi:hypothetical protein
LLSFFKHSALQLTFLFSQSLKSLFEDFVRFTTFNYVPFSMRNSIILAGAFAAVTLASPYPVAAPQAGGAGCKKVVLIFARGSTETGTMGT